MRWSGGSTHAANAGRTATRIARRVIVTAGATEESHCSSFRLRRHPRGAPGQHGAVSQGRASERPLNRVCSLCTIKSKTKGEGTAQIARHAASLLAVCSGNASAHCACAVQHEGSVYRAAGQAAALKRAQWNRPPGPTNHRKTALLRRPCPADHASTMAREGGVSLSRTLPARPLDGVYGAPPPAHAAQRTPPRPLPSSSRTR